MVGRKTYIERYNENVSAKSSQAMPPFASVWASYRQSSHFIGPTWKNTSHTFQLDNMWHVNPQQSSISSSLVFVSIYSYAVPERWKKFLFIFFVAWAWKCSTSSFNFSTTVSGYTIEASERDSKSFTMLKSSLDYDCLHKVVHTSTRSSSIRLWTSEPNDWMNLTILFIFYEGIPTSPKNTIFSLCVQYREVSGFSQKRSKILSAR